jgi:hypothetical protein
VCLCLPLSLLSNVFVDRFPWQRIHETIEKMLEASFSIRSMSYQRRVYGSVCLFPIFATRPWNVSLPFSGSKSKPSKELEKVDDKLFGHYHYQCSFGQNDETTQGNIREVLCGGEYNSSRETLRGMDGNATMGLLSVASE